MPGVMSFCAKSFLSLYSLMTYNTLRKISLSLPLSWAPTQVENWGGGGQTENFTSITKGFWKNLHCFAKKRGAKALKHLNRPSVRV